MNKALMANAAAAMAAMSAGASVVATRILVAETDPVSLVFYRYVIASVCMAPVLVALWPRDRISSRDWIKIAVFGALFFGFFPWAFNAALQYTTAARGAVGLATVPIQTLIIAAVFGRETLTGSKLLSVALAFAGIAVVFGPEALKVEGSDYLIGDGLMLLGAFSAALYSAFSRPVLGRYGPVFMTGITMVFGVLSVSPLVAVGGTMTTVPDFTSDGWIALIFLGTLGGAVQFTLFTWALRWLPPSRVVIYIALNPISAMLLAVVILGEPVTVILLTGLALVISGILVANLRRTAAPAHDRAGAD